VTTWTLPSDLPHLDAALRDAGAGSATARWVAALALSREDGPRRGEAVAALAGLAADPVEEVRSQAIEGLAAQARSGDEPLLDAVRRALRDPSPMVRCSALEALAAVDGSPSDDIVPLLSDPSSAVRATAARALGDLEGDGLADLLAPLLGDGDPVVCEEAALALCRLGDPRGADGALGALARGGADAPEVAVALGRLRGARAAPALRALAGKWLAPDPLRAAAAAALVRCGDAGGRAVLVRMLGGTRSATRLAALGALARLPVDGLAPATGALLDGRSVIEASAAIGTLAALAGVDRDAAAAELERRRGRLSPDLDEELAEALAAIGAEAERCD
jgi:HEAT repeat protein